jgi:hypothetical protein
MLAIHVLNMFFADRLFYQVDHSNQVINTEIKKKKEIQSGAFFFIDPVCYQ